MTTTAKKREWTDDVERVLEAIRYNSVTLSNYHKERYYYYKSYLKYFKLPLIALSSLTSIASVGLPEYVPQKTVSLITCILSLVSATIASVELYLGIQKTMETEMLTSRNFMLLAYDIYRVLSLKRENRVIDGRHYLDEKYNDYSKLIENANLVKQKHIEDKLTQIPHYAPFLPNSSQRKPFDPSPVSSTEPFIDAPPSSNALFHMSSPNYGVSSYSLFSSGDELGYPANASDDTDEVGLGIDKSDIVQLTDVYHKSINHDLENAVSKQPLALINDEDDSVV